MAARVLALGLLGVALLVASGVVPLARFTAERIDVHLQHDHVEVEGTYEYVNPFPIAIRQGLTFPLPPGAPAVALRVMRGDEDVPLRRIAGQYRFELPFAPNERVVVLARYRQYTPNREATYLLTTTQPWRRPLKRGHYVIHANGWAIAHSSYPLVHGSFERTEFMPRKDWMITWRKP